MDFWRIVSILNRRKWLILLSTVVAAALTAGTTRLIGSKWTATVHFSKPENISGTPTTETEPERSAKNDASTYFDLIKSKNVVGPVLAKLNITKLPDDFYKNVAFEAEGPRLFALQVTDASPTRAEEIANGLATKFIEYYRQRRTDAIQTSVKQLTEKLHTADKNLADARTAYDAYRDKHHIIGALNDSVESALFHLKDARQKRGDLDQRAADLRAQIAAKDRDLKQLPVNLPVVRTEPTSPMVTRLQEDLDKAEQQLTVLRQRYTDDWPAVKKAIENRDTLRVKLNSETSHQANSTSPVQPNPDVSVLQRQIGQLREELSGLEAQQGTLDVTVASANNEIAKFRGVDSPLSVYAGNIAQAYEQRSSIVARKTNAENALDAAEMQTPITISRLVDSLNPPENITEGRAVKLILIAALAGLLCVSGVVIGLDSIDTRLKGVKEAEIILPTRVIAAIPQPYGQVTYSDMARVSALQPSSLQAESYRFLGLRLLNECGPNVRSLMVISAKAEQGSTTAITNLAITLAQAGKRVVLVDANIRTAELHTVFNLPNKFGYADLLQDPTDASLAKAMHKTDVQNLTVITSGPAPDNPWQLFRSNSVNHISHRLRDVADYILYDTPSSLLFTDAMNLAHVVDAAFLSVRALQPLTGGVVRILEQLEQANVTMLGAVLNDVPVALLEGFRNYQQFYGPDAKDSIPALQGAAPDHNAAMAQSSLIVLPESDNRETFKNDSTRVARALSTMETLRNIEISEIMQDSGSPRKE